MGAFPPNWTTNCNNPFAWKTHSIKTNEIIMELKIDLWFEVRAKNNVSTRKEECFISYSFVLFKKGIHFLLLA